MKKILGALLLTLVLLSSMAGCGTEVLRCEMTFLDVTTTIQYRYTKDDIKSIVVNGEKITEESDSGFYLDKKEGEGDINELIKQQKEVLESIGFTCN